MEVEGITGGACEPCTTAMLRDIHRETGWAYHLVIGRACAHLFEEVTRLLRPSPDVRVVVDRRYANSGAATPPLYHELRKTFAIPPRPYHLVIRRDCAHLQEDLAPLLAGRPDIRVLVDRRDRSRTPPPPSPATFPKVRQGEPPAWLV